ncbi:MAG: hypothetical protein MZU79_02335 [Anaerotruncus sp.]|nr:hypothetical protein [Anaerotruncus sp.]
MAHELNQPLTGIRNFAANATFMVENQAGEPGELKRHAEAHRRPGGPGRAHHPAHAPALGARADRAAGAGRTLNTRGGRGRGLPRPADEPDRRGGGAAAGARTCPWSWETACAWSRCS